MKSPLYSKAFWLNVLTAAVAIIALAAQMPELSRYLPWLMLLSGALNIVLRVFFTALPTTLATESTKRTARRQRRKDDAPVVFGTGGTVVAPKIPFDGEL